MKDRRWKYKEQAYHGTKNIFVSGIKMRKKDKEITYKVQRVNGINRENGDNTMRK